MLRQPGTGFDQLRPGRIQPGVGQAINTFAKQPYLRLTGAQVAQRAVIAHQQIEPRILLAAAGDLVKIGFDP
ncbi:hypothetical protein D3C77_587120 [compost metagenome]